MALLEGLLVPLAQRHHGRHVDLVEGREHGGGALRLDEPPRDRRAPLRHADPLLGARPSACAAILGRRGGAGFACGGAAGAGRSVTPAGLRAAVAARLACRLFDVPPHHAAGVAAAAHLRPDRLRSAAPHCARSAWRASCRDRPRAAACAAVSPASATRSRGCGRAGGAWRTAARRRTVVDHAEHLADLHVRAFLVLDLPRTPACRRATSRSILSVSSSTSGSPAATASPSFFSHCATRASTTDSPSSRNDDVCGHVSDALVTVLSPATCSVAGLTPRAASIRDCRHRRERLLRRAPAG